MIARRREHERSAAAPEGAPRRSSRARGPDILSPDLILEPISRRPTILPDATVCAVHDLPVGAGWTGEAPRAVPPRASIVVVARDNLVFTKLCLESVIAHTDDLPYELIVVDNGSGAELATYLDRLSRRIPCVKVIRNATNRGFAAANNQGLGAGGGSHFRPPE